jgi:hypothetical protein
MPATSASDDAFALVPKLQFGNALAAKLRFATLWVTQEVCLVTGITFPQRQPCTLTAHHRLLLVTALHRPAAL